MITYQKRSLITNNLRNRNFYKRGYANTRRKEIETAVIEGFLDLPEPSFIDFFNSSHVIVVGTESYLQGFYHTNGLDLEPDIPAGEHFCAGYNNTFEGRPFITLNSDKSPEELRLTLRHEVGHGLDHIQADYDGYASEKTHIFGSAVDDYFNSKQGVLETELGFEGDRSFRYEHIPLYRNHQEELDPQVAASELAAEMFNKFSARMRLEGIHKADAFMSKNYLSAWFHYKDAICPSINNAIKRADSTRIPQILNPELLQIYRGASTYKGPELKAVGPDWSEPEIDGLITALSAIGIDAELLQERPLLVPSSPISQIVTLSDQSDLDKLRALSFLFKNAQCIENGIKPSLKITFKHSQQRRELKDICIEILQRLGLKPHTSKWGIPMRSIEIEGADEIKTFYRLKEGYRSPAPLAT